MKWLQRAIHELISSEIFWANFTLNSKIAYDRYGVKTAGATVANGVPLLIFNSQFMESLKPEESVAVLKHEILHLMLDHCNGRMDTKTGDVITDSVSHHYKNIAMDCAINQYISHIPEGGVTLEGLRKATNKANLEEFQTAEYYYSALQDLEEKSQEAVKNMKTTDDHNLEGIEGEESDTPLGRAMRKAAIRAAADRALKASAGKVSGELSKLLGELLSSESQVDWKSILRNFIAMSTSNKKISTRKKPHRRFDMDFPGKKSKRELRLGVCVDTSGSVGDDQYITLMKEVIGMAKETHDIYLIQADAEVKKVEKINGKKDLAKLERSGYGGTAYQPAISKALELKCNAIVYLGDMDCADEPNNPYVPVLWVTVGSTTKPGNFGWMLPLKNS